MAFNARDRIEGYNFFFLTYLSLAMFYTFGEDAGIITQVVGSTAQTTAIYWPMFANDFRKASQGLFRHFFGNIFTGYADDWFAGATGWFTRAADWFRDRSIGFRNFYRRQRVADDST